MQIKIFIVTYNNHKLLNDTLGLLINSDISNYQHEINIINNHSNFKLGVEYLNKVNVLHNNLRPDFSTGHLARNWNQALILGFENLKKPVCDIVIGVQDDTIFYPHWTENIINLHKKYSFITYGWGDNFMSWTPEGVRRIGLWDERFVMSGHTSDYFLRALVLNKKKSSINDYHHKRILNPEKFKVADRPDVPIIHKAPEYVNKKRLIAIVGRNIYFQKYPNIRHLGTRWTKQFINNPNVKFKCKNYIQYPYFEFDVETLKQQNYI